MRGRRAAAIVALALFAVACGREGPITIPVHNEPASGPAPIVIAPTPPHDTSPVVWTAQSDKTAIRVVMTPREPIIGEDVRFDVKMSYGKPPYRPGAFDYTLRPGDRSGESASGSCGVRVFASGRLPKPPHAVDDNMRRTYRYFEPGPHTFSLAARPGCPRAAGALLTRTFTVAGTRPVEGRHLIGSDGQRQVDVLVAPEQVRQGRPMYVFAAFQDRTRESFGWRVSFGDGERTIAGGPACKPGRATSSGRYDRRFAHTYDHSGHEVLRIEISPACLTDAHRHGAVIVSEMVEVR